MCTVSAVSGAFQRYPFTQPPTPATIADIKAILRLCERIDRRLGEPDCIDPEKQAWLESLEKRVEALEAKQS